MQPEILQQMKPSELLALLVQKTDEKNVAKKVLEEIEDDLKLLKDKVKDLFVEMGVKQMKVGKTVYLAKQIWAGTAETATNLDVAKALDRLNLGNFVSYNHQSLSAYVREITREHPEWFDREGDLIADTEAILKVLPEPLDKLLKVTEVVDIKVRAK